MSLNIGLQAKCLHLIGNQGRWNHFQWQIGDQK